MIKKDKTLLIFMTVGLSLMLILRDVYSIQLNKYLYLAFVVGCMVLANYQTLVSMICFILPLVCGLPATYIMAVAVLLLIFKRGRLNLASIFLVVCLSILEIIASFWYPEVDIPLIVQYVSFLAVLVLLTHNTAELDYEQSMRMYLYGVLLVCGVIVVATLQDAPSNWLEKFARGAFRFGVINSETPDAMTLTLNANTLAYYSVTGITCGIFMAERRKGAARIFYIVLTVFVALAGFFTISRSWLIVTVLCLLLYILSKLRTPKQFLALAGVLVVLFVVGAIWVNKNPWLMDGFIARFSADDVETGSGRTEIFFDYMEFYFSDPRYILFGTGVTRYHEVLQMHASMHNGTQQVLVCTGFVGFVLYMFVLIGPVLRLRMKGRLPMSSWLPLISVVAFVQTIQFLNPMMLMLPYVMGIYGLRMSGEPKRKISEVVHGE